jgi:hypothetical protein
MEAGDDSDRAVLIAMTWSGVIDSDDTAAIHSGVVVVMIDQKAAIDMAVVNSDVGVAADSAGGAVMSLAAMAAVNSEVPAREDWEVPVEALIDSDREATMDSDVMVVTDSDIGKKGD